MGTDNMKRPDNRPRFEKETKLQKVEKYVQRLKRQAAAKAAKANAQA